MDPLRKQWNEQQQALRQALAKPGDHDRAVRLFLEQHAMVHTAGMSQSGLHSFEDEVWQDLNEQAFRCIPPKFEHSIAWNLWHLTRIEDMTMNVLVAGRPQLFIEEGWRARLNASVIDTASAMDTAGVHRLSNELDMPALREYRIATGRRTRQIVQERKPGDFKRKVALERIQRISGDGGVVPQAGWLLEYWSGLTVAGLLLMPPTRHPFVHINEMLKIKQKVSQN